MKKYTLAVITLMLALGQMLSAQCVIDSADTTNGFTPRNPAVIQPGVAYAQTVQVHIPTMYQSLTIDSIHIDTITGMPAGITYIGNPASQTVPGGGNGALCFSGTTQSAPGPYVLSFIGFAYIGTDSIPLSEASSEFSYKFRVETAPVAAFIEGTPSCAGDSTTLNDESTGYPTSWTWTIPNGSPGTSHLQNPNIFFDSAGTFQVTLIAKNAISADTITQTITINPAVTGSVLITPATGDSTANGMAIALLSGGTPPFTYLWSTSATTDTISNLMPGTYWVLGTDANGCQYVNDNVNVTWLTGIAPTALLRAGVYPNPASTVLNLLWPNNSAARIEVCDLNGQTLSTLTTTGSNNTIDIHNLSPGTYLLRLTDELSNQQQTILFAVVR